MIGQALMDYPWLVTPTEVPRPLPDVFQPQGSTRDRTIRVAWEVLGESNEEYTDIDLEGDGWSIYLYTVSGICVFRRGEGADYIDRAPGTPNDPVEKSIPGGRLLRIGVPYAMTLETIPFVAQTETGSRRGVTKSRIYGVYIDFNQEAPTTVKINSRIARPRRHREKPTDQVESVRIGGLTGWRRRQSLTLELRTEAEMAGLFYRASG